MKNKWLTVMLVFVTLPLFAGIIEIKYDDDRSFSWGYTDKPG